MVGMTGLWPIVHDLAALLGYITASILVVAVIAFGMKPIANLWGKLLQRIMASYQLSHAYTKAAAAIVRMPKASQERISDHLHECFHHDVEELHRIALHIFTPTELGRMRITIFRNLHTEPEASFHDYHRGRMPDDVVGDMYVAAKRVGIQIDPDKEEELMRAWHDLLAHWRPPFPSRALRDATELNQRLRRQNEEHLTLARAYEHHLHAILSTAPEDEDPTLIASHHHQILEETRDMLGLEDVDPDDDEFDEQVEHDWDEDDTENM